MFNFPLSLLLFCFYKKGDEQFLSLPVVVEGRGADVRVSFRAVGRDGEIVSQVTRAFHVEGIPDEFSLHQNYPNPFNPVTKIEYDIPEEGNMSLRVYDLMGREVRTLVNGLQRAGYHEILWNGMNNKGEQVAAGLYLYQMKSEGLTKTMKMVLIK